MNIRKRIEEAFKHKSKLEELENVYVPLKTVDVNKDATFNERALGMLEMKESRLKQLKMEM